MKDINDGQYCLIEPRDPSENRGEYTYRSIDVPQGNALDAILEERDWQDRKHGVIEEHGHTVGEWILIMERELAEAKEGLLKGGTGRNAVMHEIVQVCATGLAALEQHGLGELPTKWGNR